MIIKRLKKNNKLTYKVGCYDSNFKKLIYKSDKNFKKSNKYILDKNTLNKLKEYCSKLSNIKNLMIRIDFYNSVNGLIFGEFTPHPGGKCLNQNEYITNFLNKKMKKHKIEMITEIQKINI